MILVNEVILHLLTINKIKPVNTTSASMDFKCELQDFFIAINKYNIS